MLVISAQQSGYAQIFIYFRPMDTFTITKKFVLL